MLADKIIQLRKKQGWSQEELADRMHVSRQAVSKWESAQALPDLDNILLLSELFGVSTDYLLKEDAPAPDEKEALSPPQRRVDLQEAQNYLAQRQRAAIPMALGALLCILSPICLIFLSVLANAGGLSEVLATVIGLVTLFVLVTAAVAVFILCAMRNEPYLYLDREPFTLETGAKNEVEAQKAAFRPRLIAFVIAGVCLCILSPVPLVISAFLATETVIGAMVCVLLAAVGIAVALFVTVGMRWGALQRLLHEGEFTEKAKRKSKLMDTVGGVYWLAATAIYLAWSFGSDNWGRTWIIWPVAAVLFGILSTVCDFAIDREHKEN